MQNKIKKSKPNLVPLASGEVVTHCSKLGKCHSDIHLECQKGGGVCQIIHYLEGPQEKKGQNIKFVKLLVKILSYINKSLHGQKSECMV